MEALQTMISQRDQRHFFAIGKSEGKAEGKAEGKEEGVNMALQVIQYLKAQNREHEIWEHPNPEKFVNEIFYGEMNKSKS